MNGLRTVRVGHYFIGTEIANPTIEVATSGLIDNGSGQGVTTPSSWTTITNSFGWNSDYTLHSDGSKGYQAVRITQVVPTNTTLCLFFNVTWCC